MTADQALKEYGSNACVAAYNYNIIDGEGRTFIEINTGIPKHDHGAAIAAGEHLTGIEETNE